MNKNHLRLIKGLALIIFVVGIFSSGNLISEKKVKLNNLNQTKNKAAFSKAIDYETVKVYNKNLPAGTQVTKEEGHKGLVYVDENGETIKVVEEAKNKVIEIGTAKVQPVSASPKNAESEIGTDSKAEYVGKLTGYGADCVGCSGNLACKTREGKGFNLYRQGIYYNDSEYGTVRIIAAALNKFPCGTIMKIQHAKLGTFNAIVLDTGGAMRKAWNRGIVHIDLAYKSESDPAIHLATSSSTKYSVLRWGY